MYINYPSVIKETEADLEQQEKELRPTKLVDRVRMLRFLKSGQLSTLEECAVILGYNVRQLKRWWKQYKEQGLQQLTQPASYPGKPSKLTEEAWNDLENEMCAGRISSLRDAQIYLKDRWGITYSSLHGVWWQFHQHQVKLKTGRRRHRKANQEQQERVKKTSKR
jgi:transposase